ncbi:sodium/proline symporter PutP [uncultured Umboniibacter sp.]|uniref:sodium/proline symporter PutP n=1 Tax=uncultured Umboniibacter sp. TaxID=1798917 RepID=UPI002621B01D|nr:sodium/proline symporter PutP [uncultured Umboniibacter sp.]
MDTYLLISIGSYFLVMLAIGLYAYRNTQDDVEGYLLGGRQLTPGVMALSAGASDMSGWILMGLPGAMYISGLSSAWIAVGLVVGAYLNYRMVAPRLRVYTELANDAVTIPDFLGSRFNNDGQALRTISALVIIVFFTLYTSAGLVAGGKLFESAFGQSYELGIMLTAGVVVAYTLFGGFLAVSLTDFVQGCIMFLALVIVPVVAFTLTEAPVENLKEIDPQLLQMTTGVSVIAIISSAAWGLGYFGQPHIIVRFMAIRSIRELPTARRIGMGWMIVSVFGALGVGLIGRAYSSEFDVTVSDPETIFIILSQIIFHPLIAGFLLAAILAAIMSTISSQLLVSASSLSEDLFHKAFARNASSSQVVLVGRLSVVAVCLVAGWLALDPSESILGLVGNAWAGFGAAFGPIILLALFWRNLSYWGAVVGMITGAVVVLIWIRLGLGGLIYEIVPGFIAALGMAILVSLLTPKPTPLKLALFDEMKRQID